MRSIITVVFSLIILPIYTYSQRMEDWANLKNYQEANAHVLSDVALRPDVVFMGNSITQGWQAADPNWFSSSGYANRGIGGQTTPQMLLRFRQDVVDLNPKFVVIMAGTNDIAGNTGPSTQKMIVDNLRSMTDLAIAHEIGVVLCSVIPSSDLYWSDTKFPAEKITALNAAIEKYAVARNFTYVDFHEPMSNQENGLRKTFSDDGVHPNAEGYILMKSILEPILKGLLQH